jgi:hypothetical protein
MIYIILLTHRSFIGDFSIGSCTLGERFDPVNYCLDIVDNLPNLEDGYYWVTLNTTKPRKVLLFSI